MISGAEGNRGVVEDPQLMAVQGENLPSLIPLYFAMRSLPEGRGKLVTKETSDAVTIILKPVLLKYRYLNPLLLAWVAHLYLTKTSDEETENDVIVALGLSNAQKQERENEIVAVINDSKYHTSARKDDIVFDIRRYHEILLQFFPEQHIPGKKRK